MKKKSKPYVVWRTEEQIRERVRELARQINQDMQGQELHVLGILRGSFIFMADLIRCLEIPVRCQFINLYYKDSLVDDSYIKEIDETVIYPTLAITDKHVLIVSTGLDTGIILDHLLNHIQVQGVKSVKLAVLIDKPVQRRTNIQPDYIGFEAKDDEFVFGYGLDVQEEFRNLPYLATFK